MVSTESKRQNKTTTEVEMKPCLQKDCDDLVKMYLPLCPLHYHQCISGKSPEVELKDGLGTAKFNTKTQLIDYPSTVPKDRFPLPRTQRPNTTRKALVFQGERLSIDPVVPILVSVNSDEEMSESTLVTFYIDSGAGQCLCSCSSAFITMEACHLQVVGVAGRLTIHGQGTAVFIASVNGQEVLLRIHNCLHSFGQFNLISVSQLKMVSGNSLNFSVENPFMKFSAPHSQSEDFPFSDGLEIPIIMDEGLYSVSFEPITASDPRFGTLPVFDVTPPGTFIPITHMLCASAGSDEAVSLSWTTEVISPPSTMGRVLALNAAMDFDHELSAFSDDFLAPVAIPPARKQYDVGDSADMTDLSIRFMGAGTDRITHTVGISNGLEKPPSKTMKRVPPKIFPQGKLKRSKTPIVSKGKVGNLHTAHIAEVLYTDTFESGDLRYPL